MVTVDLTTRSAPLGTPDGHLLAELPRRLSLTLPELRLAAELAGGAPLPFSTRAPRPAQPPGSGRTIAETTPVSRAYAATLDSLPDPRVSLARRGLVTPAGERRRPRLDPGLAGAIGLLATGDLVVEMDVSVGALRARSWHRQSGPAVATLSTMDGLVFELAWFGVDHWPRELARSAVLPQELPLEPSAVPADLCAPYDLVDAAGEALRTRRAELVDVLVAQRPDAVHAGGQQMDPLRAADALRAVHEETRGQLRVLTARVRASEIPSVGVVSWLLLADGWHAVVPRTEGGETLAVLTATTAEELPGSLAVVVEAVSAG